MESKHTPGPWISFGGSKNNGYFSKSIKHPVSEGAVTYRLIINKVFGRTLEECEANAALIAAAPDMLEALKELDVYFYTLPNETGWTKRMASLIKTTMAKATNLK